MRIFWVHLAWDSDLLNRISVSFTKLGIYSVIIPANSFMTLSLLLGTLYCNVRDKDRQSTVCHLTFLFVCLFLFFLFFFLLPQLCVIFLPPCLPGPYPFFWTFKSYLDPCSVFYIYVFEYFSSNCPFLLYILSPYWFSMTLNSSL